MSVANGTTDRTKTKTERSQFFLEMANIRSPENAEVKFVSKRTKYARIFSPAHTMYANNPKTKVKRVSVAQLVTV